MTPATARPIVKRVRLALLLVLAGLLVQLVASLAWSPLMFVVFACFGVTAVGAGAMTFLWTVWRHHEPPASAPEERP